MPLSQTTLTQDAQISRALSDDHIANLAGIIEILDAKITEWEEAASVFRCSTPRGLKEWYEEYSRNEGAAT